MSDLDSLFKPSSIAVVGASHKPGKIGYAIIENLINAGFKGSIYPVNPKGGVILGFKVYRSISDLPDGIDLALIALPSKYVVDSLIQLAERGVKSAIIYTAGFSEIGEVELEDKIRDVVREYGIRIIGPNCAGVIYWGSSLYAGFVPNVKDGDLAILSQSGAFTEVVREYLSMKKLGLHLLVSYGNRVDISDEEIIDYFSNVDRIKAFMIYLEGFNEKQGLNFCRIAKRVRKPIVMLKAGRGSSGARAAKSHTGVMAGDYKLYLDIMKQAGVYLVDEYYELVDVAEGLAYSKIPRGDSIAIVTNSGGPNVILTDMLESKGYKLTDTPATVREELSFLPEFMVKINPIDMTANANPELYYQVLRILMDSDWPDLIIVIHVPPSFVNPVEISKAIKDAYLDSKMKKPIIPLILGFRRYEAYKIMWEEPRLPTPFDHRSTAEIVDALYLYRSKILRLDMST